MKLHTNNRHSPSTKLSGVTLVELSVVIAVIIILVSATTLSTTAFRNWQAGLEAGETLKGVYQAQKLFLADNPTTDITDASAVTAADIIPYLPSGELVMPQVIGLDDVGYAINFNVMPPTSAYGDKSAPSDNSVWDAGK